MTIQHYCKFCFHPIHAATPEEVIAGYMVCGHCNTSQKPNRSSTAIIVEITESMRETRAAVSSLEETVQALSKRMDAAAEQAEALAAAMDHIRDLEARLASWSLS